MRLLLVACLLAAVLVMVEAKTRWAAQPRLLFKGLLHVWQSIWTLIVPSVNIFSFIFPCNHDDDHRSFPVPLFFFFFLDFCNKLAHFLLRSLFYNRRSERRKKNDAFSCLSHSDKAGELCIICVQSTYFLRFCFPHTRKERIWKRRFFFFLEVSKDVLLFLTFSKRMRESSHSPS